MSTWETTGSSPSTAISTRPSTCPLIVRDPRAAAAPGRGRPGELLHRERRRDADDSRRARSGGPAAVRRAVIGALSSRENTPARWRREAHFEFDFPRHPRVPRGASARSRARRVHPVRTARRALQVRALHRPCLRCSSTLKTIQAEMVNRAEDPQYQERMLEYAQKMLSWRMSHDERVRRERPPHPEWVGRAQTGAGLSHIGVELEHRRAVPVASRRRAIDIRARLFSGSAAG